MTQGEHLYTEAIFGSPSFHAEIDPLVAIAMDSEHPNSTHAAYEYARYLLYLSIAQERPRINQEALPDQA